MVLSTFITFIVFIAMSSATLASSTMSNDTMAHPSICGAKLNAEHVLVEKEFQRKMAAKKENFTFGHTLKEQVVTVPVYWSVVYADTSAEGGYLSDSQIVQQIQEVNRGFQGTGLQFELKDIDRFQNAYWFHNVDPATNQPQYDMKQRLRYGALGPAALNVYSVGLNNIRDSGTLGYSSFPADYPNRDPVYDGILIRYSTLPGGSSYGNNMGRILTHEIGHWVGLYHPFENFGTYQNGCSGPGDYVNDTPAEAIPARGCPVGLDTCTGDGPDPITNFMDYTIDACRTQFTPGQIQRLQQQVYYYRSLGV